MRYLFTLVILLSCSLLTSQALGDTAPDLAGTHDAAPPEAVPDLETTSIDDVPQAQDVEPAVTVAPQTVQSALPRASEPVLTLTPEPLSRELVEPDRPPNARAISTGAAPLSRRALAPDH